MRPLGLEPVLVSHVGERDGVAVLVQVRDGTLLDQDLVLLVALVLDVSRFLGVDPVTGLVANYTKN